MFCLVLVDRNNTHKEDFFESQIKQEIWLKIVAQFNYI